MLLLNSGKPISRHERAAVLNARGMRLPTDVPCMSRLNAAGVRLWISTRVLREIDRFAIKRLHSLIPAAPASSNS
jgi:hypothetical protein